MKGTFGNAPRNFQSTASEKVAIIVTSLIMCIVAIGVFAAAPGLSVILGIAAASAMIALIRESKVSVPAQPNPVTIQTAHKDSTKQVEAAGQNRVLKIVLVVLSSIVAVLLSAIGIAIIMVIALISAFVSFCESCFELLQPPC